MVFMLKFDEGHLNTCYASDERHLKFCDRLQIRVDTDQTALQEQSDLKNSMI